MSKTKVSCPSCGSDLTSPASGQLRCGQCGTLFPEPVPTPYSQPDIPPRPLAGKMSAKNPLGA